MPGFEEVQHRRHAGERELPDENGRVEARVAFLLLHQPPAFCVRLWEFLQNCPRRTHPHETSETSANDRQDKINMRGIQIAGEKRQSSCAKRLKGSERRDTQLIEYIV